MRWWIPDLCDVRQEQAWQWNYLFPRRGIPEQPCELTKYQTGTGDQGCLGVQLLWANERDHAVVIDAPDH